MVTVYYEAKGLFSFKIFDSNDYHIMPLFTFGEPLKNGDSGFGLMKAATGNNTCILVYSVLN